MPWRTSDPAERAKPVDQRADSTNYHYALPAMAQNLCASGAGHNLSQAIFAYNHADWYVAAPSRVAPCSLNLYPPGPLAASPR